MSEFVQIDIPLPRSSTVTCAPTDRSAAVFWLQGITLIWMLAECGLSLYAAAAARSPAMLAFASDSFVELLSAGVVLLQFSASRFHFPTERHSCCRRSTVRSCSYRLRHGNWLFGVALAP